MSDLGIAALIFGTIKLIEVIIGFSIINKCIDSAVKRSEDETKQIKERK